MDRTDALVRNLIPTTNSVMDTAKPKTEMRIVFNWLDRLIGDLFPLIYQVG